MQIPQIFNPTHPASKTGFEFYTPGRPEILLAEDDDDIAQALGIVLGRTFNVTTETCGRDALRTYEIAPPDLLLLDYQLPDMNGLRLFESIRRRTGACPPIVMISAFPSRREDLLSAGVDCFLEKPFETRDLVWAIEQALHRH